MRPCRSIRKVTTDNLNNLEKYDNDYLDSFQGHGPVYGHLQFKDLNFLSKHSGKQIFGLLSYCLFSSCISTNDFLISPFQLLGIL